MKYPANDNRLARNVLAYYGERLQLLRGWRRAAMLCLFGGMATLALPPFFAWPLLWLAFPSVLWLILRASSAGRAFWDGWWFGFGFFVSGLYWFAYALLVDAAKFGWLIPPAVFGISGILALYTGLVGWLTYFLRGHDRFNWLIGFPTFWMAVEWVRGYLFTGFPWNLMGYSFGASEASLQSASLFGAFGLSWFTVLLACLPVIYMTPLEGSAERQRNGAVTTALLLMLAGLVVWGQGRLQNHPTDFVPGVTLRLVQPAIDQYHKSQPAERQNIIRKQAELTLSKGYEHVTHIVWPETAMPFYFTSGDYWAKELATLIPENGLLMTGVVRPETSEDHRSLLNIYNSFSVLDRSGEIVFSYDKRKLVPFGEFVPFRHILPLDKITPGSLDFSRGRTPGHFTQAGGGPSFFPLICYEAIFPSLSQDAWPSALLNVTNDGWFGISTGPYQHLEMSRMRAVEQGVPMIRAANSGISAMIDPYGRLIGSLGLGEEGVLDVTLPASAAEPTLYGLYGGSFELMLLMVAMLVLLLRSHKKFI
jgi:apolipoprotein N-acyltransferase